MTMLDFHFPKWGVWAAAAVAVAAVAGGATLLPVAEADTRTLDSEPEVIAHALESVEFESVGQMAVTSPAVVRATVTAVNPGRIVGADETAEPGEETAATQAREVTLQVNQAFSPNGRTTFPAPIKVEEWGWDASGDGYQVNNYKWSEVGKEYVFFLRGSATTGWNVISTEGRAEILADGFLSSSAEEGSALKQSIESYDMLDLTIYLKRIYDTKNPPPDLPTAAEMPVAGPSGYENSPLPTAGVTAEPTDLGTNDGSEPTPYPSST
ncbi:hypothetical protein OG885_29440 [Streptomyces sp. NBC_00028]|uniref:hypothetical protein n=1 Tax=Streptomyces sp. NBC_00028 TaxID=2975624 RepID=UPI00185B3023|nr:hypothetical protein [Streptomyces sp.]